MTRQSVDPDTLRAGLRARQTEYRLASKSTANDVVRWLKSQAAGGV